MQASVAEPAVQALDDGVLDGLAWGDLMPLDAATYLPDKHRPAGKIRAIVSDDHQRQATPLSEVVELACDTGL